MNGMALCAGVGGLELGLSLAVPDYRCVCYVEREAYAAAVLVQRMEEGWLDPAPVWDDLITFDGQQWRGVVDIISAGFPCQPWSAAGRHKGAEDDRWLWDDIAQIVRQVGPSLLFLENVPGLVRGGIGDVLGSLALLGYDAEWDLFSAQAVGAPHIRQRIFILAHGEAADPLHEGPQGVSGRGGHLQKTRPANQPPRPDRWLPEPDVPRVDDGTPNRVDRIRAIGNGVVPAVAATAFRVLRGRLEVE